MHTLPGGAYTLTLGVSDDDGGVTELMLVIALD